MPPDSTENQELCMRYLLNRLLKNTILCFLVFLLATGCMSKNDSNESYLLTISELTKIASQNKNLLIVDIRPKDKFKQIHIPHSININPSFFESKKFLAEKNVVLVYGGINRFQAVSLAKEAESKGFKFVRVLDGGLTAWVEAGKPVLRAPGFSEKLHLIKANELYLCLKKEPGSSLILKLKTNKMSKNGFLGAKVFSIEGNSQRSLEQGFNKLRKKTSLPIIVVDENGDNYKKVQMARNSLSVSQIFYLEGGLKAYRDYIRTMSAWAVRRKNSDKSSNVGCE